MFRVEGASEYTFNASTLVIGKRLESRLKTEDEPLALDAWDEALRES